MKTTCKLILAAGFASALVLRSPLKESKANVDMDRLRRMSYKMLELLDQINAFHAIDLHHEFGPWLASNLLEKVEDLSNSVSKELRAITHPRLFEAIKRIAA